jgi:hypothetical protein
MKRLHTSLITAALLTALGGMAHAQSGPMGPGAGGPAGGHGMRMEQMHERMAQRHATHLNELKGKLKLEASQEAAWNTFAQAMQPMPAAQRPDRAAMEKLSTPERIDQMMAFKAQRDAHMQKHAEATKTFYATLNAEQKKTFDAESARMLRGMGEQGMMARHHGAGHGR